MIRKWLTILAMAGVSLNTWAEPVYVAKIINFNCPYCRASESHDVAIEKAVSETGGVMVWGPVSPMPESNAKDRVYFSVRDVYPELEAKVRGLLYFGSQDLGQPFEDVPQVLVYLQQELGQEYDWARIGQYAYSTRVEASIAKAKRLAISASVDHIPAYVFIKKGEVVGLLDNSRQETARAIDLKNAVLEKLKVLSKEK